MLRQYELVERVRSYDPDADEGLINRAYVFTMMRHGDQRRHSGDPYFAHPIEVAAILTDIPCITTLSGATAAAEGIAALQKDGLTVRPLQEIHRGAALTAPTAAKPGSPSPEAR